MIWEYEYTKELNTSILEEMIKLYTTLRPKFIGLYGGVKFTCVFSEALTPDEHDELNVVVDQYSATHKLVVREGIENNVMNPAMQFGTDFLKKFSSNNVYLEKTDTQINTLLATYPSLILTALTGSLKTLYTVICSMTADDNISQVEIDEFKLRLEIYLGLA